MPIVDTSRELIVQRYLNGFKLVKPSGIQLPRTTLTFGALFEQPINVFFLNTDSLVVAISETNVKAGGFASINDMIGKDYFSLSPKLIALKLRKNDLYVLKQQTGHCYNEDVILNHDDSCLNFLTIKYPCYDSHNALIGIIGCSIETTKQDLAQNLNAIMQLGFINACQNKHISESGCYINNVFISKREEDILRYLARGHTAKQIASILYISSRTVEKHLVNIKMKLDVRHRSDLINLVIDQLY